MYHDCKWKKVLGFIETGVSERCSANRTLGENKFDWTSHFNKSRRASETWLLSLELINFSSFRDVTVGVKKQAEKQVRVVKKWLEIVIQHIFRISCLFNMTISCLGWLGEDFLSRGKPLMYDYHHFMASFFRQKLSNSGNNFLTISFNICKHFQKRYKC